MLPTKDYGWKISYQKMHHHPKKSFILTHFVGANHMYCTITDRSITGTLHFLNKTPIDLFSKRQATVEKFTYGSIYILMYIYALIKLLI